MDLAWNNKQRLICHKTQITNQHPLPPSALSLHASPLSSISLSLVLLYSSFLPSFSFLFSISFNNSIFSAALSYSHMTFLNYTNADLLVKRLLFLGIWNIFSLFLILLNIHRWFNVTWYHPFLVLMMVHLNRNVSTLTFFYIKFFFLGYLVFQFVSILSDSFPLFTSSYTFIYIDRRRSWCNCYRRGKWTRWHEFKSWVILFAFHIELIPLGKLWIWFSL